MPTISWTGFVSGPRANHLVHKIEVCVLAVYLVPKLERKEEIWLSPMTKAPTPTEKPKKQRDNTQTPQKTSITQRLQTDLRRSAGVRIATQQVWLNRLMGYQPSHLPQPLCNRRHEHGGIVLQLAEISICIVSKENDIIKKDIISGITGLLERTKTHYFSIQILWNIVVSDYTAVAISTWDVQLKWQQTPSIPLVWLNRFTGSQPSH